MDGECLINTRRAPLHEPRFTSPASRAPLHEPRFTSKHNYCSTNFAAFVTPDVLILHRYIPAGR